MNTYGLVLFLHVAAATALVGGSMVATPLLHFAARRAATVGELRAVLGVGRPLRVVNPVSSLAVMITGAFLSTLLGWWRLGWVQVALGAWLVNVVVARRVVVPHMGRLAGAIMAAEEGPIPGSVEALRRSRSWALGTLVLVTNDAVVLLLMTTKPGLGSSLLAVAAAQALLWIWALVNPRAARGAGAMARA